MEARATAKYIRVSPQKARLVIDLIRGKNAGEAMNILHFTKKRVTREIEKVLRSAISNAEQKSEKVDVDRLFVSRGYVNDAELKKRLKDQLRAAGVASIEVERPGNKLKITIFTARPGIIIGRKGAEIDRLRQEIQKRAGREVLPINIQEVHRPELNAQLVAESIALQLEKRVAFRRAMRKAVDSALRFGCKGIKIRCGGGRNGAESTRTER